MEKRGVLNRKLKKDDIIHRNDLEEGKEVWEYNGDTYGWISPNGVAVSDEKGGGVFYEVPKDAVDWDK